MPGAHGRTACSEVNKLLKGHISTGKRTAAPWRNAGQPGRMSRICVHATPGACYIDHMRARLRSFFLCLLIVSLPLQGIAGVARFECGMAHHPLTAAGEPGGMQMDTTAAVDSHDGEHGHAAEPAQSVASPDQDCDDNGSHARSGCGTCASCSIGAYAPPPVMTVTAVEEAVSTALQFSSSSFTGHVPARIERPPRTAASIAA